MQSPTPRLNSAPPTLFDPFRVSITVRSTLRPIRSCVGSGSIKRRQQSLLAALSLGQRCTRKMPAAIFPLGTRARRRCRTTTTFFFFSISALVSACSQASHRESPSEHDTNRSGWRQIPVTLEFLLLPIGRRGEAFFVVTNASGKSLSSWGLCVSLSLSLWLSCAL